MNPPDAIPNASRVRVVLLTIAAVFLAAQVIEAAVTAAGLGSRISPIWGAIGLAALIGGRAIRVDEDTSPTEPLVALTAAGATALSVVLLTFGFRRVGLSLTLAGIGVVLVWLWRRSVATAAGDLEVPEHRPASQLRGLARVGVVAALTLSFLVTAITSVLLPSRSGPDERHHYSYVKHTAENPYEFPPRFEHLFTDDGSYNHLMHPPLYYQLMAIPYRLIDPDRSVTTIGAEADRYGRVSSVAMIPLLRAASLLFIVVHLAGLFLLLRYLTGVGLLRPWAAVVAAACLGLVPAYTFIGGTLNNDALAMALWPLLGLSLARFYLEDSRTQMYLAVLLTSAAALTKPTLWFLVATVAVFVTGTVVARARRSKPHAVSKGRSSTDRRMSRVWRAIRPSSTRERILGTAAAGSVGLVLYYLVVMQVRYGSFHPFPRAVYGLAPSGSPGPDPVPISPLGFVAWSTTLLFRSLFGVLGQHERLYEANPLRMVQVLAAVGVASVGVAVWRLISRRAAEDPRPDRLAAFLLIPVLVFIAAFLVRGWSDYHTRNHISAQGRYLIGYIDLWLIGTLAVLSRAAVRARDTFSRWAMRFVAGVCAVALVWLFVDPLFYLSKTGTLHQRMRIDERVEVEATARGLKPVDMSATSPDRFVTFGADPPRFRMSWTNSTITGQVDFEPGGCVEAWVYVTGDTAWSEPARLEAGLLPMDAHASDTWAGAIIPLQASRDVARFILSPDGSQSQGMLTIRHTNVAASHSTPVDWFWPRARHGVTIHQVYAGPSPCPLG